MTRTPSDLVANEVTDTSSPAVLDEASEGDGLMPSDDKGMTENEQPPDATSDDSAPESSSSDEEPPPDAASPPAVTRRIAAHPPLADVPSIGDAGRQSGIVPLQGDLTVGVSDTELDFCTLEPFEVRACSTRGASHRYAGTPRQDSFALASDDDWLVVTVADGVSAGAHSFAAADTASRVASKLVLHDAGRLDDLDWQLLSGKVSRRIVEEAKHRRLVDLTGIAEDEEWREVRRHMSTTAVVAAVGRRPQDDGSFPVHVAVLAGDSGAYVLQDGEASPLAGGKETDSSGITDSAVVPLPGPAKPSVLRSSLREGEVLVLVSDGIGDPLGDGSGEVGRTLAERWRTPPTAAQFFGDVNFLRKSFDDDRTAVGIWLLPIDQPAAGLPDSDSDAEPSGDEEDADRPDGA